MYQGNFDAKINLSAERSKIKKEADMSIKKPIRYAFLQIPNYSMVTFSSAVASLRGANYISKQDLYEWQVVSMDGVLSLIHI